MQRLQDEPSPPRSCPGPRFCFRRAQGGHSGPRMEGLSERAQGHRRSSDKAMEPQRRHERREQTGRASGCRIRSWAPWWNWPMTAPNPPSKLGLFRSLRPWRLGGSMNASLLPSTSLRSPAPSQESSSLCCRFALIDALPWHSLFQTGRCRLTPLSASSTIQS